MFFNTVEQTQLFNYSHNNINCSGNEGLGALTAWHKCMLLRCSNALHATLCYSSNMAPYVCQMARRYTCNSNWLPSFVKISWKLPKKEEEAEIVHVAGIFFKRALLLLPFELRRGRGKSKDVYCLWLHQALFKCSQSVILTVDIHLSLITWPQIGGLLDKVVWNETTKTNFQPCTIPCLKWFIALLHRLSFE